MTAPSRPRESFDVSVFNELPDNEWLMCIVESALYSDAHGLDSGDCISCGIKFRIIGTRKGIRMTLPLSTKRTISRGIKIRNSKLELYQFRNYFGYLCSLDQTKRVILSDYSSSLGLKTDDVEVLPDDFEKFVLNRHLTIDELRAVLDALVRLENNSCKIADNLREQIIRVANNP